MMLSTRLGSNGARSGTRSWGLRKRCSDSVDRLGVEQRAVVELDVRAQLEGKLRPSADWVNLRARPGPDAAVRLQAHQRLGQVVDDARQRSGWSGRPDPACLDQA